MTKLEDEDEDEAGLTIVGFAEEFRRENSIRIEKFRLNRK